MKCQVCGSKDATVHLTEIKNGKKHEMHLCEKCAAEKGLPGKAHFSISDLLAGLASAAQTGAKGEPAAKETSCSHCGLTLSKFQASGRFGCPDCYGAFKDDILPLIEKIHDASQHTGKSPQHISRETGLQKDLRLLQQELKRAVKREAYEEAVQLRDKIKTLEDQLKAQPAPAAKLADEKSSPAADKPKRKSSKPKEGAE